MTLSLDLIAGVLAGIASLAVFGLHVVSDPEKRPWMNMPKLVRAGLWMMGATMMMRSVNILTFVGRPGVHLGQINGWAVFSWFGLCAGILPLAWWIAGMQLPDRSWERLEWVREVMKRKPGQTPIMVPTEHMVEISRASGQAAVDGYDVEGVAHEGPRYAEAIRRSEG